MTMRSVGYRLQTDGKADVVNDFAAVKKAGQDSSAGIAEAAEQAAERSTAAAERYTERQIAAFNKQANAAKLAAAGVAVNSNYDAALASPGSGGQFATVNLNRSTGAARASAGVFEEQDRQAAASAAAAAKVLAAVDPLYAAEQRLNAELRQIALAEQAGVLSADQLAAATARVRDAFDQARASAAAAGQNFRMGDNADAQVRAYYSAMASEQDRAMQAALRLKAAIDPLWAAEQRLEQELREVATAEKAGILSADLLGAAQARARKQFDDTTAAIKRQTGAGGGLSAMQRQTLLYTASDIIGSSAYGINPQQLLLQQGPQVLQAFAAEEGGLAKLRALLGPTTLGIAGVTAAVATGAKAWLDYADAIGKADALAQGSGRLIGATGAGLEQAAEAGAAAGHITVASAREIEAAFLQTGKIGQSVFPGLIALTNDFAAATGEEMPAAAQKLAAAFADPAKGAEELTARYGILSQAQIEHIHDLVEENNFTQAQIELLNASKAAFDGAADHANVLAKAWRAIENGASDAWLAMGKAIDRAVTGGATIDRLNALRAEQAARANGKLSAGRLLNITGGDETLYGTAASRRAVDPSALSDAEIARQIAVERAQATADLARNANAQARSRAVGAMKVIDGITGDDALGDLKVKLGAVNAALADGGKAAGLTADQIARAREAQDGLTHAVTTFLSPEQKRVQLAAADEAIARARTPAQKEAAAARKAAIELSGQVITRAGAEAEAHTKGAAALATASKAGAGHAATMARDAASMEVNARAALDVADAYLKSSAAGLEADARRKASTDATRKGIDVEAQARRQLALQVAEGTATAAKAIAQTREDTEARTKVLALVGTSKLGYGGLNDALSDEAALRPLLALRTIAHGDALAMVNREIEAQTQALNDNHAAQEKVASALAIHANDNEILGLRDQAEFAGDRSGKGAIEIARRAAEREAADKYGHLAEDDPARTDFVNNKVNEARTKLNTDRTMSAAQALQSEKDRLTVTQAELGLVGKSADEHDRVVGRLQLQLQLAAALGDEYAMFAPAILAARDAADAEGLALKHSAAAMDELRGFGSDFADKVLSKDTWASWGAAGKTILGEIKNEFIKLALLNPLKNLINGNHDLPGFSSVLSKAGSLFGGGKAAIDADSFLASSLGHNASGTERWSGGMTYVNENGGELMDLPGGTRIYPAAESRRMMAAEAAPAQVVNNHFTGNLMTPEFWAQIQAGDDAAAQRGAFGGAALSQVKAGKRARRTMR